MSKYINVNPDHYKTAGRERPGDVPPQLPKPKATDDETIRQRWERLRKKKNKTTDK